MKTLSTVALTCVTAVTNNTRPTAFKKHSKERYATNADCRLADLQTCRPADLQTCRPADLQTCRPTDLRFGGRQSNKSR